MFFYGKQIQIDAVCWNQSNLKKRIIGILLKSKKIIYLVLNLKLSFQFGLDPSENDVDIVC